MKLNLEKVHNILVPVDDESKEFLEKLPNGNMISGNFSKRRNYKFHKKYFALLNFAFEHKEFADQDYIDQQGNYHKVLPNFERFRKDLAILSGFYIPTFNINGEVRLEAKSISFSNMDDDEFEVLYSKTIDVILQKVLPNYDETTLNDVVLKIINYV